MKRGQSEVLQTTMLFEIIISILVGGILFWALVGSNDFSLANENYLSIDLQYLTEFVESMPGDVEISYPVSGFGYECEGVDDKKICKLYEDEYCSLKIVKKDGEVSYEC